MLQESGWWQSDHGNTTPSLFSDSDAQEDLGANLVKARSLPWTYRNTHTDFAENSVTDTHSSIDAQQHHQFGDEFEGRATRDGLVRNNDNIRVLKSFKDRSAWSHKVTSTGSIWGGATTPVTSTLLEAQESGEMMEHMDEANFALDGLRPEQPLQIQRASLQSVLSLCGSMQRRRILRTHRYISRSLYSHIYTCIDFDRSRRSSPEVACWSHIKFITVVVHSHLVLLNMAVWWNRCWTQLWLFQLMILL